MADSSLFLAMLLQLGCALLVMVTFGSRLPLRLSILLSSAFVTAPVFTYASLADAGSVYLFDLVVPLVWARCLWLRHCRLALKPVRLLGLLIVVVPMLFAPLSYLFLDPAYFNYHSLLLGTLLVRSVLIYLAVLSLVWELSTTPCENIVRLMAAQSLVLFGLGALQYVGGVDLVVYERLKDTESVVDVLLGGDNPVLIGFGFLGLFRGAVPHMAAIGLFWWTLRNGLDERGGDSGVAIALMVMLAVTCVAGSLSRIGIVALAAVLCYIAVVNSRLRAWAVVMALAGTVFVALYPPLAELQQIPLEIAGDRFTLGNLTGATGSGGTRIESALRFVTLLNQHWYPWLIGLGGYNPIAANEYFGVFGMHGDYLDVLARYGVVVGALFGASILAIFANLLRGFHSQRRDNRAVSRAVGVLAIAFGLMAATQGVLTFSGSAGYLGAAHAWLAIAFCIAVRRQSARQL